MDNLSIIYKLQTVLDDDSLTIADQIQTLWSGYGQIIRVKSEAHNNSYIVKVVAPEAASEHPRGWNTDIGHRRKLRSYQVENCFYQRYSALTDTHCQVPQLVAYTKFDHGVLLVMDDLDAMGFSVRKTHADWSSLQVAIRWLAFFHGQFMGNKADGLWHNGTYWHLATRHEEWQKMPAGAFKIKAQAIDNHLSKAKYQTLVHGDAKYANLCFHVNEMQVAAVDFQYVGQGCGVKDLAYLVGSCLDQDKLAQYNEQALNEYITQLKLALSTYGKPVDLTELEVETRALYPVAWADFYRFLLGWNPQSWKIGPYMQMMAEQGLKALPL